MAPYLIKRGHRFYARVAIPRDLRHLYPGRTHLVATLGTGDLAVASQRKVDQLKKWDDEFKAHRNGGKPRSPSLRAELEEEARRFRESYAQARDDEDRGVVDDVLHARMEAILGAPLDELDDPEAEIDPAHRVAMEEFADRARGVVMLMGAFEEYAKGADIKAATVVKYRRALRELLALMGRKDARPELVTDDVAEAYVEWLNTKATSRRNGKPLDPATKRGRVNALSAFWQDHLERRKVVPKGSNPWRNHTITGTRQKATAPDARTAWSDADIIAYANGPERGERAKYTKRTLVELLVLGLYTGARLEELCARTLGDVVPIKGGYLLKIHGGKSAAATRDLPVLHPLPVAVLKGRIGKRTDPAAYLFAEFVPGGPDGKRSWQVQKALGHYRDDVGLPDGVVFHTTRNTFATLMERLAIPEAWADRYFGHKARTLRGRVYAQASPESLATIARKVKYPARVEKALEAALKGALQERNTAVKPHATKG